MYGGIDNVDILSRDRDPSAVSAVIAKRMAVHMACLAVPQDFSIETSLDRKLFPFVDLDTTYASDPEAIEKQVQWLLLSLFGEYHSIGSTDVAEVVDFFDLVQSNFANGASCIETAVAIMTQYNTLPIQIRGCLIDLGYLRDEVESATLEDTNYCLAQIDDSLALTSTNGAAFTSATGILLPYLFETNGLEIPVDLDGSNYITYLTDACNEHKYEGHLWPSGCYATEDFYDRENLSTKKADGPSRQGWTCTEPCAPGNWWSPRC